MADSPSEGFRNPPNDSARFGNIPQDAEAFGTLQNTSERKSDHSLNVREVARMFEAAGVARTERSITNWCQPNKTGIARLDAFFDSNERKYFITPRSVEVAIQEEQSKERTKGTSTPPLIDTGFEKVPNHSAAAEPAIGELENLRREVMDLKILNQSKDYFIKQFQQEREQFVEERERYVEKLIASNREIGQLETRLGIEPPTPGFNVIEGNDFRNASEAADSGATLSES